MGEFVQQKPVRGSAPATRSKPPVDTLADQRTSVGRRRLPDRRGGAARLFAAGETAGAASIGSARQPPGYAQPMTQMKPHQPLQLKWIDNGSQYLVWDAFIGQERWYFNQATGKMFYRQAETGEEAQSEEKTREEWIAARGGHDPLAQQDASIVKPLDYQQARQQGNLANRDKEIEISFSPHWSATDDHALEEIGNQWIAFGGDPLKPKEDHECSGSEWNTLDEGADVAHDMYQPRYRDPETALAGQQRVYRARYKGEVTPIAVMMLEVRQDSSVQENHPFMYLRWLVAHPTKGGGAAPLMQAAIAEAAHMVSQALRVESARSAIAWYGKQGLTLFKQATHNTDKNCGCGEMGTTGKFKDQVD